MKKLIILLLLSGSIYSQNYEVYVGSVISRDKDMHANYIFGANFIIKTNQNRKYLNNLIFGFSHEAFMSGNMTRNFAQKELKTEENCNCEKEYLDINTTENYTIKKEVRGIGFVLGVEVLKRLYLSTGVTAYQHITLLNSDRIGDVRTMTVDGSVKYFIPIQKAFITTTLKYNAETVSIGLGYSR